MPSDQLDGWEWRGTDQGTQMKTTTGWENEGNGTNSSGFTAVAGGYRYGATGAFNAPGILTYWWTADVTALNLAGTGDWTVLTAVYTELSLQKRAENT